MRFGTFRNAYRSATRHFGSDVRYRRFYSITPPRNSISAVLPYLYTRTNPVTLRLEDQATDGSSSNLRQLFATSMSGGGSSLFSPASEMSALVCTAAYPSALAALFNRTQSDNIPRDAATSPSVWEIHTTCWSMLGLTTSH
ncbi:hypothetical protein CSUI_007769, partial [Cystoisospora suis]